MAQQSSPAAKNPWTRAIQIALILLIVVGVVVALNWSWIESRLALNDLHRDDGRVRRTAREALAASDWDGIDDMLRDELFDADVSFHVRTQVGAVLIQRNRMPVVEDALRSDDLDVRTAALTAMFSQIGKLGDAWFSDQVVAQPAFRVEETVLAWLDRKGDDTREKGVEIAAKIRLEAAIPTLRGLTLPEHGGSLTSVERRTLVLAARALLTFGDCDTLASYVDRVKEAEDDIVKLRLMQILHEATLGATASCKDAVPPEAVEEIVLATLDAGTNPKHGALLILTREPAWAAKVWPRLRTILDGAEGDTVQIRRAAMDALVKSGDDAFARLLPRYFHDEESGLRSQAVGSSRELARDPEYPLRYESCWAGMLRNETVSQAAFDSAVAGLRDTAAAWIGVPEDVLRPEPRGPGKTPPSVREKLFRFRREMFEQGESAGLSRLAWADAWLDWFAGKLGLSAEEQAAVADVRIRLREAMERGDVEGVTSLLQSAPHPGEGLYTYEEGWLQSRE